MNDVAVVVGADVLWCIWTLTLTVIFGQPKRSDMIATYFGLVVILVAVNR